MKPPTKQPTTLVRSAIVDADALIALFNPDDAHAQRAFTLLQQLTADGVRLLHPSTTITEAVTTLQRRFSNPQATAELVRLVRAGQLAIAPVDEQVLSEALARFAPHGSKQNTLFDAVVAAVATRQHADVIFSFDHWYKKQGFILATEWYAPHAA